MSVADLLTRCREHGAVLTPEPDGTLDITAPYPLPDDLMDGLRQHKLAILAHLRYRQKYPGDGPPGDAELREIEDRVYADGYVLLWSNVLADFVAFYKTEEDRKKIPPGFIPYSEQELEELFGEGKDAPSPGSLRLIHEAKKCGGRVIGSQPEHGTGGT